MEVEEQNYAETKGVDSKPLNEPLFCFAISAKRYVLFNMRGDDLVIRKASAHGLGHLSPPYRSPLPDDGTEAEPRESGVAEWQEDVWKAIVSAALAGNPRHVDWKNLRGLKAIAASQHTVSTPALLGGFRHHNKGRTTYAEQIKPFNFMLWFHPKTPVELAVAELAPLHSRKTPPKPTSPYYRDLSEVPADAIFDRDVGAAVPTTHLRTYAEVLFRYHRSPESKFLHGGEHDITPTRRRHVLVDRVFYIGKEADAFEEREVLGDEEDDVKVFGLPDASRKEMVALIAATPVLKLKAKAKVGHAMIERAGAGDPTVSLKTLAKLYRAAVTLKEKRQRVDEEQAELVAWAEAFAEEHSWTELAQLARIDISNLRKAAKSERFGAALSSRLQALR